MKNLQILRDLNTTIKPGFSLIMRIICMLRKILRKREMFQGIRNPEFTTNAKVRFFKKNKNCNCEFSFMRHKENYVQKTTIGSFSFSSLPKIFDTIKSNFPSSLCRLKSFFCKSLLLKAK